MENVSEFKYLGCVLDESDTDVAEGRRNLARGRRVADAIKSLVNARDLQLEWDRLLLEILLVPVLVYDSETVMERGEI